MQFKLSTVIAVALASTALAVPSPNKLHPFELAKRCGECTKPAGSVCQSGCKSVSPTQFVQACNHNNINIGDCAPLQSIMSSCVTGGCSGGGLNINAQAGAHIDSGFSSKIGSVCDTLGTTPDKLVIQGGLDVGATAQASAGGNAGCNSDTISSMIGSWGGSSGGSSCSVCHSWPSM